MKEDGIITRSQLYEQVWRTSMVKLAKSYGMSDVGLAKLCRKHNIPRPPRGYWAKVQAGQSPKKTKLPDPNNDCAIAMRDPDLFPSMPGVSDAMQQEIDKAKDDGPIEVGETLRGAHALAAHANQAFQDARKNDNGLLAAPEGAGLAISVSKSSLRRALLIMDALVKTLEKRGYAVTRGPAVELLGVKVGFSISEGLESKRLEPEEHELEGSYRFGHSRFREDRAPSGKLTLKLDGPTYYRWSQSCRRTWSDGKAPLESKLKSIVEGIVKYAARLAEQKAEDEREERQREEAKRRREEEAKRKAEKRALIKAERKRIHALYREARNWKRSRTLREYIEARRAAHPAPDGEFAGWLKWAADQADRLDPLTESPPSILDEDTPDLYEPPRRPWE